jgi:xylan 1,4-beta-xylosidase
MFYQSFVLLILAQFAVLAVYSLPLYPPHHTHSCIAPNNQYPFCDITLPIQDRVADLISRLTLAQKIANRYDLEIAIPELGLDTYNYNQEGLHGLGAQCFAATATSGIRCPTVFAAPPALASSWNRTLLLHVGDAISTEARAYNNFGGNRGYQNRPVDLNAWLPSINLMIDSRWGRAVETYSEDPWATGQFGANIVNGAQNGLDGGISGNGYLKLIVAVKHATAYQVENNRFARNENISLHDLSDTFYPSWEAVMEQGKASGFMCAYPSLNNVPCCGDTFFETELMKDTWGMGSSHEGGSYVQGDCGAIENIASQHHYAANKTFAAAVALNAGTDVDCGSAFPGELGTAIELGLVNEQDLDASLTRTYTLQFLAGRFDPVEAQPYLDIPFEDIGGDVSRAVSLESGTQGMVLLRNDFNLLPINRDLAPSIAVIGPLGNSSDLAGNYYEQACPDGTLNCIPTLFQSLSNLSLSLNYSLGCTVTGSDTSSIAAAVAAAQAASIVILALGTNTDVAQEGNDRADTSLPGVQYQLAMAVLAVGKPTVVLLFNGGLLAIDDILALPVNSGGQHIAIVECFFPGNTGAIGLVNTIISSSSFYPPFLNRWGKLPVTYYPVSFYNSTPIDNFNMIGPPGRTYKYYIGPVLFPFGFGLSYTTFALSGSCPQSNVRINTTSSFNVQRNIIDSRGRGLAVDSAPPVQCSITVTNTGSYNGDEVVFVYFVPGKMSSEERLEARRKLYKQETDQPIIPDSSALKILVAFERVSVAQGQQVNIPFTIEIASLAQVDDEGNRIVYEGDYSLEFSRGHGDILSVKGTIDVDGAETKVPARVYPKRHF